MAFSKRDWTPEYKAKRQAVLDKIVTLKALMVDHASEQKINTSHYGYIGDLGHIEGELDRLIQFISNEDV